LILCRVDLYVGVCFQREERKFEKVQVEIT
jgi:hypothetical protein